MNETLDKILAFLKNSWKRQKYEYRFLSLNGTENNKQLKISNSIEYEFINSGNSLAIINDGFILYPAFMGIEPTRQKFTLNKNEQDVGVYEYRFESASKHPRVGTVAIPGPGFTINILMNPDTGAPEPEYNELQVVVKQISRDSG